MATYELLKQEGSAKRAVFHTVHGDIQTPVFMNVGTVAAIKGAVSTMDLKEIKCQVELSNTYHLHVRPGDKLIKEMGGLHKFMVWDRPILTDSGGFQVFSLAGLRKIKEEGVYFHSHVDGAKIFMGPEESMQIQSNLGSTIAMAFDECPSSVAERRYVEDSVARTTRWLERCKKEMQRLNSLEDTINKEQLLFGINQGAIFSDIRTDHAKRISELDLDGYAIGGLAVGETHEQMYQIIEETVPYLPKNKPTYLMGVGTPANIADIHRDRHDCRIGARNHDQYVPQGFIHRVGPHELHLHHPINCLVRFLDSFFLNRYHHGHHRFEYLRPAPYGPQYLHGNYRYRQGDYRGGTGNGQHNLPDTL